MELLPPVDPLWTIRQACAWLSLSEHALRTMLRRNQLPAEAVVRLGRRIRFKSTALRAWVDRRSA
jgi:excisionase family DNA binding protein